MQRELLKKTYYYDLPQELIAQTPIEPRDHSRLLCYNRTTDVVEHKHFYDIVDMLKKGDILVVNNTKVLPARLFGFKFTGAKFHIALIPFFTRISQIFCAFSLGTVIIAICIFIFLIKSSIFFI